MKAPLPRIAASHRLGLALLASACAHGVFLLLALNAPEPGRSALSQRQGSLTVVHIGPLRPPTSRTSPPLPPMRRVAKTARAVAPQPQPLAPLKAPEPPTPAAPEPIEAKAPPGDAPAAAPPPPTPAQPGSAFTSLFAPILSQPLGRGRWGAPPRAMPPPDPWQLRRQAWLALTTDMRQRLQEMPDARCDIRLDADSREGSIECDTPENDARAWAVLQGLLRPGTMRPEGASALCLQTGSGQTLVQTCPTDMNRNTP